MQNIKGKLGFGFMRLPMNGEDVDLEQVKRMADYFMENGFNYFDTAHGYVSEKSEAAICECVSKRFNREDFILTNKLTGFYFEKEADIRPFFEQQLKTCGVDYFDFYLLHAQNAPIYEKFKKCRAYETAFDLKKEGKIRHVGISFHDKAAVLEQILTEYPQIEVVQIQFNYIDYDSEAIEGKKCYDVCKKFNKPIIVMEPVKGGSLVNLPDKAKKETEKLKDCTPASLALRYVAEFDGIMSILSGMSNFEQLKENVDIFKNLQPLSADEKQVIENVRKIIKNSDLIACTACGYCLSACPQNISIPDLFSCMNAKKTFNNWNADFYYNEVYTKTGGKASDCIECGMCERECPQNLKIPKLLKSVAKEFEKV